jgi:DNA repair protein RadA/Sms
MNTNSPLDFLTSLFTSLDGEEVYLAPADDPELCYPTGNLNHAARYIDEQKARGVFLSTGTFMPGTARQKEHLLCVLVVLLDADLKDCLAHEGWADAEAKTKVQTCTATQLTKLRATHVRVILDTLRRVGIDPSALIFSGNGHHAHLFLDFLDQRDITRIRAVHKALVATLNSLAGFPLFDKQATDSGTRYFRVPGTANTKSTPARWAEVVQNSGPTYTLEQLEYAAGSQAEHAQEGPNQAQDEPEQPQAEQTSSSNNTAAIVRLLLPYWTVGSRHALAVALSGYLANAEWTWKDAKALLLEIGHQANDEELRGRLADLKSTYQRIAQGKPVAGYSSLESLLSPDDLQTLQTLVGVQEIPIDDSPSKLTLITRPYSEIQERDTSWVMYPHIPDRNIISVEGNPGEGKSWVTLSLCAAVSIGKMPFLFSDGRPMEEQKDRDLHTPANVLHLNVEDDPEETIKKRLRILGADCSRVHCIEGVRKELADGSKVLNFTVDMIPPLEESIIHHKARLVVLDPIQAYLPKGADMNKAESMRPLLGGLMQMARRIGCAVLLVRHFGKRMTDNAIHKAIGSIDFAACVRSVLIVGRYPKEADTLTLFERGVVTNAKNNLAPKGLSLDFQLQQDSFRWIGTSNADASDFTGVKDPKGDEEWGKETEAMEFLREILATGPADRAFLVTQGKNAGIHERILDRAALRLRIKKQRVYKDGKVTGATWELPSDE